MRLFTAPLVVLLMFTSVPALFAETANEPYRQPNLMDLNEEQAAQLTPILQQIRGVLAIHLIEMAALEAKIVASDVPLEVYALERQVADSKLAVEIRILEIQADFALREGRTAEAGQFSERAENLRRPAPREVLTAAPQRQEVSR